MNTGIATIPGGTVQGAAPKGLAPAPIVPGRRPHPEVSGQLQLLDPYDDGRSWDDWFRSLPLNPWGER